MIVHHGPWPCALSHTALHNAGSICPVHPVLPIAAARGQGRWGVQALRQHNLAACACAGWSISANFQHAEFSVAAGGAP